MIFNIMFLITASLYWYFTGHVLPVFIGTVVLFLYTEKLAFAGIVIGGFTILSIIYYFFVDFFTYDNGETLNYGIGVIYMLIVYIKVRKLFNNDDLALD